MRAQQYVTDVSGAYLLKIGAQRGFEPLTHALRIHRSIWRCLSINILRTPNAIFVGKTSRKSACGGTKVATVFCVNQTHRSRGPYSQSSLRIAVPIFRAAAPSVAREQ